MYNGSDIFKLVDTYGLPLDIINVILREEGECFNAVEFINKALQNGWPKERIYQTMINSTRLQGEELELLKEKINQCF